MRTWLCDLLIPRNTKYLSTQTSRRVPILSYLCLITPETRAITRQKILARKVILSFFSFRLYLRSETTVYILLKSGSFWELQHAMCETAFTRHAGKDSPEFLPQARSSLTLSAGREKSAFSVCFQWSSGFRASNCSVPNCNSPGPWPGNSYFRIPNMPALLGRAVPSTITH